MEEDWQGLRVGALKGPVGQAALKGGAIEAVLEFLEEAKVGCRSSLMATVGPVEKEGEISEGGEGPL